MDRKGDRVLEFCKLFEDILKCPVCDKKLNGDVYMCGSGHSICNNCQNKGTQCTKCHTPYTKMKNLLVQELLSKLGGIKMGLSESNNSKTQSKQDKMSLSVDDSTNIKGKLAPNKFRCWIIKDCEFIGHLVDVIGHLKSVHPLEFEEDSNGPLPYKRTWQMSLFKANILNRALKIADNNIFYLNITKNNNAELSACILMCARNSIASQFSYKIEIECNDKKLSYNGQVESARLSKNITLESDHKCLFIDRNEPLYHELQQKLRFKCSIMIKKDESADTTTNSNNNNSNNNNDKKKRENDQQSSGGQKKKNDQNNQSKSKNDSNEKNTGKKKSGIAKKNVQEKMNKESNKQSFSIDNSSLKKEINKQHQHTINLVTNKHLVDLKTSAKVDIDRSMMNCQSKASLNNMSDFCHSPQAVYQPPYTYNQFPPQSNQLYPNLGGCGNAPGPITNYYPPVMKQEMVYQRNANVNQPPQSIVNHFHVPTMPSAPEPYDGPSTVNSDIGQRSSDVKEAEKEVNKCPVS